MATVLSGMRQAVNLALLSWSFDSTTNLNVSLLVDTVNDLTGNDFPSPRTVKLGVEGMGLFGDIEDLLNWDLSNLEELYVSMNCMER